MENTRGRRWLLQIEPADIQEMTKREEFSCQRATSAYSAITKYTKRIFYSPGVCEPELVNLSTQTTANSRAKLFVTRN